MDLKAFAIFNLNFIQIFSVPKSERNEVNIFHLRRFAVEDDKLV